MKALLDEVLESDLLLFSYPLYCYGMPASLKAFADRTMPLSSNPRLLPNADEVLYHPEQYLKDNSKPQILLPYKFGMDFANERIGTGLSVKDKQEIFSQLSKLMKEFADMAEPAQPINQSKAVHNTKRYIILQAAKQAKLNSKEYIVKD